jgi:hypothetical protein
MTVRRLIAVAAIVLIAAAERRYAGRPLVDALRGLESQGLRLIYSDDVVPAQAIVKEEPRASDARKVLDELLAPHSLRATAGPRGTLLIVRVEERNAAPAPQMPIALAEIIVTPSQFEILSQEPERRQFMSRDEVRRVPHLADDLFRAIARVPGTTSSDVTARPNIRGGSENEVSVLVDGAEVYDPFHLRDLFRAFSTIDAEAVGAVDILTGGFPSEYGGRMSGVIDVDTLAPSKTRTEIGISLLNTRLLSQGSFGQQRGEWLFSLRRGYLREVLQLIDDTDDLDPSYYDLLGKLQWTFGNSAVVSAHVLAADDRIRVSEFAENATARSRDAYLWLNARGVPRTGVFVQSVLSVAQLETSREGTYGGTNFEESGTLHDERSSRIIGWKNDATVELSPRNVLKGGVTLRRARSEYDYAADARILFAPLIPGGPVPRFTRTTRMTVSGSEISAYLADRVRLGNRLVAEAGVRLETETHTPDGVHINPRLNVAWTVGRRTSLRAAWGRFSQPQYVYELPVEDGVNEFSPSQRAEHRVIGIDHQFNAAVTARVEAYEKNFSDLRPRFENIFDRIVIFPELRFDRVRIAPESARARGAEMLLRIEPPDSALSGWVSYSRSEVTDRIAGVDVARAWDQRNAVNGSINYRIGAAWNFNVAGTYHTGWPITPVTATFQAGQVVAAAGPLYSLRLPAYRRVDLRVSRNIPAGRGGFTFFLELFNVLNQSNIVRVDYFNFSVTGEQVDVAPEYDSLFGVLPSFGVTWHF